MVIVTSIIGAFVAKYSGKIGKILIRPEPHVQEKAAEK
jgi:hypothetical protein